MGILEIVLAALLGAFIALPATWGMQQYVTKQTSQIRRVLAIMMVANALIWASLYLVFAFGWAFIIMGPVLTLFTMIVYVDLKDMIIPDLFNGLLFVLGFIWVLSPAVLQHGDITISRMDHLFGLLVGVFVLIAVEGFSRIRGKAVMGGGDVKMIGACGLLFGWQIVLLGIAFSSFVALAYLLLSGGLQKDRRGQEIPYGPYLVIGWSMALFFGLPFVSWYLSLFGV